MAGLCHLAEDLLEGWQHAYAAHEVQQVCVGQQGSLTCRQQMMELGLGSRNTFPVTVLLRVLLILPPGVLA